MSKNVAKQAISQIFRNEKLQSVVEILKMVIALQTNYFLIILIESETFSSFKNFTK